MTFKNEAIFISVIAGIFIFLMVIGISALIYEKKNRRTRYAKDNPEDWLLHDFNSKLYHVFFSDKDVDEAAIKIGINIEQYYKNCALLNVKPDTRNLVIKNIYGIVLLMLSFIFLFIFHPLFMPIGLIAFLYFSKWEVIKVKHKAGMMRETVKSELPQFLELLSAELIVGIPIDRAIQILCEKYDSLLSKEFLTSLNDVKLGAGQWQQALENVAYKYEIETLSDFVLDIEIAFRKGISVTQSVITKTKDIKQKHLLNVKEKAGKTENTILIPIALLQFIPMLIYILLPTLVAVGSF